MKVHILLLRIIQTSWKSTVISYWKKVCEKRRKVFTQLIQLDPTQIHIEELLYNLEDFS